MWNRTHPYLSKLKWNSKWDFLPVFFIIHVLLVLGWQLHILSSYSRWFTNNELYILDVKHADNLVLQMNDNLRRYSSTGSLDILMQYNESQDKLDDFLHVLEKRIPNNASKDSFVGVRDNMGLWMRNAYHVIRKDERFDNGRSITYLNRMRRILNGIITEQMGIRDEKLKSFQNIQFTWFMLVNLLMILLTGVFIVHWMRSRKWFIELEENRANLDSVMNHMHLIDSRFMQLIENAHDLIVITDKNGKIISVNNQLAETFGYLKEELVGQQIEMLIPDRYRDLHVVQRDHWMEHPMAGFTGKGMELFGKCKNGKEIPLEIALCPFRIGGNIQVASILRDISKRKHAEKRQDWLIELGKLSNETLNTKNLIATFSKFSLGKFADWCVVIAENSECAVFEKDTIKEEVRWVLYGEIENNILKLMDERSYYLRRNVSKDDVESFPLTKEQRERIYSRGIKSVILFPLSGRSEKFGTIVFVNEEQNYTDDDVEYIKEIVCRVCLSLENARLYQISLESISMQDELLRIVSHDLKNPLNSILLNAQLIERILKNDETLNEVLVDRVSALERNADHAIKLIKDLLDNAKIETGGLKLDKTLLDPKILVSETRHLFDVLAEEKSVDFSVKSNLKRHVSLFADHERVLQVISNLLGNSIKYTDKGGRVEVNLDDRGQELEISVEDTGSGINLEKQKHLFEKYWRDTETGLMNLGLGLSIARGVVEAHGGRIWFESKEGEGSKFYFTLPYFKGAQTGHYDLN